MCVCVYKLNIFSRPDSTSPISQNAQHGTQYHKTYSVHPEYAEYVEKHGPQFSSNVIANGTANEKGNDIMAERE